MNKVFESFAKDTASSYVNDKLLELASKECMFQIPVSKTRFERLLEYMFPTTVMCIKSRVHKQYKNQIPRTIKVTKVAKI